MQRIGIVPELAPDGQMSGVHAKISAQRTGHPHAGRETTRHTPRADQEHPTQFPFVVLIRKESGQHQSFFSLLPDPTFWSSTLNPSLFTTLPAHPTLQHRTPHSTPTMGTVTTKSTMPSSLDAASLFRVDGMVAVVTGGGSGTSPPPPPPLPQPLISPQESA